MLEKIDGGVNYRRYLPTHFIQNLFLNIKTEKGKNMQIECPACKEVNQIEYAQNIECGSCKSTLEGYFYKRFKKPLVLTSFVISLSAFGGYEVGKLISDDRYPMTIEYELINACSSGRLYALSRNSAKEKTSLCICALEKTINDINYSDIKANEKRFVSRFRENIIACY